MEQQIQLHAYKKMHFTWQKWQMMLKKNTNKKGGGPNLGGSASQMGMKKFVCVFVGLSIICSFPVFR